jgi:hypothetical protein
MGCCVWKNAACTRELGIHPCYFISTGFMQRSWHNIVKGRLRVAVGKTYNTLA